MMLLLSCSVPISASPRVQHCRCVILSFRVGNSHARSPLACAVRFFLPMRSRASQAQSHSGCYSTSRIGVTATFLFIPGRSSDTFSGPAEGQPTVKHGLPGLLDGGTETEYFDQICAGDTLVVVSKVAGLDVRESKNLGKMLITTSETTYTNRDTGKVVARQRAQAIFY